MTNNHSEFGSIGWTWTIIMGILGWISASDLYYYIASVGGVITGFYYIGKIIELYRNRNK